MKNILLTFDYEIFFCKYGTVQNSLLVPTEELIRILNGNQVTFFVDVLFLEFLKRNGCLSQYRMIVDQLRKIVSMGHRVELHIHPHWMASSLSNPDFSKYRIHNFDGCEVINIFERSLELLTKIVFVEDGNYKIVSFRAGGWCIQPFSYLYDAFKMFGLKIDSSVAAGMYQKTKYHYFDFRNVPEKDWYRFEQHVDKEDSKGRFVEIPISTFVTNPIEKLFKRWIRYSGKEEVFVYGDGKGMQVDTITLVRKLFERKAMFSIDGVFDERGMLNKINDYRYDNLTFISHPKNFTNISLRFLASLMERDFKFLTLDRLYRSVR